MKKITGFSLVELMISLLLAAMIMAVLIQYYSASKRHYLSSQNQLKTEYELDMITDLLRNSIRQAGFTPCAGLGWLRVRDSRSGRKRVVDVISDTDSNQGLLITRMSENFSKVVRVLSSTRLLVEADNAFRINRPYLIADCFSAEIVTITHIKSVAKQLEITLNKPVYFVYTEPAYLGAWLEERFFIQKNGRGQQALFYQLDHAEELSNQIDSLTTTLMNKNKGILVARLVLGLVNQKPVTVETAVRIS